MKIEFWVIEKFTIVLLAKQLNLTDSLQMSCFDIFKFKPYRTNQFILLFILIKSEVVNS